MKKQPVHEEQWDHLIVLDACRFDVFKENYNDFIEGDLSKVKSRGSATFEWLSNTFPDRRYNIDYVSSNVFVNNSGFTINDLTENYDSDWYAGNTFLDVDETWRNVWSEEAGAVKAEDLADYCKGKDFGRKTVIHFIQPHRPLLSLKSSSYNTSVGVVDDNINDSFLSKTSFLWKPVFDLLPSEKKDLIRGLTGVEKSRNYEELVKDEGRQKIFDAYEENLRYALSSIEELIESLEGKIVVTADHGESLGEKEEYGHPACSKNPVLREVPWLEVKA